MLLPGETWLSYMGVPDEYPDFMALAFEISDAMWDAASDVLGEHLAANPVLRALRDDRYRLWQQVDVAAGSLPPGIRVSYRSNGRIADGVIAPPRRDRFHPQVYADISWDGDYRYAWHPSLTLDTVVQAWLPTPLDVSALIAVVAAEAGQQPPRPPRQHRPRPQIDWSQYGSCDRRGCWAPDGKPCIDVRTTWSTRRPAARPHPSRPRLSASVDA